jgi:hypothetical protein
VLALGPRASDQAEALLATAPAAIRACWTWSAAYVAGAMDQLNGATPDPLHREGSLGWEAYFAGYGVGASAAES